MTKRRRGRDRIKVKRLSARKDDVNKRSLGRTSKGIKCISIEHSVDEDYYNIWEQRIRANFHKFHDYIFCRNFR